MLSSKYLLLGTTECILLIHVTWESILLYPKFSYWSQNRIILSVLLKILGGNLLCDAESSNLVLRDYLGYGGREMQEGGYICMFMADSH